MAPADQPPDLASLLRWYIDAGVEEAIGDEPVDRYRTPAKPAVAVPAPAAATPTARTFTPLPAAASPVVAPMVGGASSQLAQGCGSLEALRAAVEGFDACALKSFASRTVFADGVPNAKVMVIGEAPGEDEDRQGKPFVGVSGQLLDKMLASIGLDRQKNFYITNIVFWRPPGNRKPTGEEIAQCLPFVQRHIELINPAVLLLLGGPSANTMLANPAGITKLRGRWFNYAAPGLAQPVPTMAMFHPAYLLRTPAQKRLAWQDLLAVKKKLGELGIA